MHGSFDYQENISSIKEGILADAALGDGKEIKIFTTKNSTEIKAIIDVANAFPMDKIIARYVKDEGVSQLVARIHEKELKRFLALCAIYRGPIGMRGQVDELWHSFLMFTEDYQRFCEEVAGEFIHHAPNDEDTPEAGRRIAALRFNATYEAAFGQSPDPEVWPLLTSDNCMNGCGSRCGGCRCMTTP
ncbi:glycine-rich domain-containing protein [Agrobacterium burrii]|uniref:Uncharacterized protein n=1 Tax=Agrobacterium burrii TaxID=2815339 RepID=A0ABS3EKT3_9HYPH|nr:hypothetical protein [Agrobacterium burrii]MBO0132602.1 hypothetical protein [Agrobacterium burrii]